MKCEGHVAFSGQLTNEYQTLVGKPELKRPFERLRRGWEDNIKMDLTVGMCGLDASGSR
jgi:hypothetical protein